MILRGTVYSKTLEMETGISIATPSEYRIGHPYKVAYLLHGLCAGNSSWLDYTKLAYYANNYDVVFVMPEVARSFYADMKYGHRYFSYVSKELPVICSSVFNISSKREDTAVIGGSMGGYGALKCALSKPRQYGWCLAFSSGSLFMEQYLDSQRASGNVDFKDFYAVFGDELEMGPDDDLLSVARRHSVEKEKPQIYLSCGKQDYLYAINQRFHQELAALPYQVTFEKWDGEHNWAHFDEALRRGLSWWLD